MLVELLLGRGERSLEGDRNRLSQVVPQIAVGLLVGVDSVVGMALHQQILQGLGKLSGIQTLLSVFGELVQERSVDFERKEKAVFLVQLIPVPGYGSNDRTVLVVLGDFDGSLDHLEEGNEDVGGDFVDEEVFLLGSSEVVDCRVGVFEEFNEVFGNFGLGGEVEDLLLIDENAFEL